jgi:hypothetical protein
MGTVPVPAITPTPLTITRSDEPVLGPTPPISSIQLEFADTGEKADEGSSPHEERANASEVHPDAETESSSTNSDPTHSVNVFA